MVGELGSRDAGVEVSWRGKRVWSGSRRISASFGVVRTNQTRMSSLLYFGCMLVTGGEKYRRKDPVTCSV